MVTFGYARLVEKQQKQADKSDFMLKCILRVFPSPAYFVTAHSGLEKVYVIINIISISNAYLKYKILFAGQEIF